MEVKPRLIVEIKGEHRSDDSTYVEFKVEINATNLVQNVWTNVSSQLLEGGSSDLAIKNTLDFYTGSDKWMKEITVKKILNGWDFERLTKALIELVRACKFKGDIKINYHVIPKRIVVRNTSWLTVLVVDACGCWFFLCITCLCTCVLPFYLYSLRIRDEIVVNYRMRATEQEFYNGNMNVIAQAVIDKNKKAYVHEATVSNVSRQLFIESTPSQCSIL